MARSPRLFTPGLFYHLYCRGNNREEIFFEESNYLRFLGNLERFRKSLSYSLCGYCLLPNHFHLLLKVGDIHISLIMQKIMTAYSMYVNKKYDRVGHVFQGRFQSIIVEKESYLLQVLRYIHLNPVKSGLVTWPEDYRWSSYLHYFAPKEEDLMLPKLQTEEILEMFSSDLLRQKRLFKEFTLEGAKEEFDPLKKQVRGLLGGEKFRAKLTWVSKGVRP